MDVVSSLNDKLLNQDFGNRYPEEGSLDRYLQIAAAYAVLENALVVLSDLKADKSYLFSGGIAEVLGLERKKEMKEIDSIWEEEIFSRIHPEDLLAKHSLELQFFHQWKSMPVRERSDHYIKSRIRMCDRSGVYIPVEHRTFYISSVTDGSLWLGLCLYSHPYLSPELLTYEGRIVNSVTGVSLKPDKGRCRSILSVREKELLRLIEQGKLSKEIAEWLHISIYTVNRHRQNILEKLRVKNSLEACRVAKRMGLLE